MNREKFFDQMRTGLLGPKLDQSEIDGCNALLDAMEGAPIAYIAYALATAYHETAHSMQPISEYGGDAYFFRMYDPKGNRPDTARRLGNTENGDGARFRGRGYVQLTGRRNYKRAGDEIGVDLIADPELAKRPDVAAKVMRRGMTEGWFTSRSFNDYLPPQGSASFQQFVSARRIINGLDRADDIASYARQFQAALQIAEA